MENNVSENKEPMMERLHHKMHQGAKPAGKGAIGFIFAAVFLDLLGAGILIPVLPYLVRQYSADALTLGLLALSFSAAQFIAAPILGALSDRYGRRPLLVFSVLGSGLAYFMFGLGGSLLVLFIARIIDGLTGGNISIAQAYIADVTPPKDRAKNFGLIGAAFGMGFIFGPALGGVLSNISLQAPAYAAGILSLVTAAFGFFVLPESLPVAQRKSGVFSLSEINPVKQLGEAFKRPSIRIILLAIFAQNFAFSGLQTNFSLFSLARFNMGPQENALVFTFIGVVGVIMQGFVVRKIVNKVSDNMLAIVGLTIMAAGFALTAFAPAIWVLFPALAGVSIGSALSTPTLTNLVSKQVSGREQGSILGTTQSVNALTRVFGPVWAGATFDTMGAASPYWTGALWLVAAAVIVLTVKTTRTPAREQAPTMGSGQPERVSSAVSGK